MCSGQSAVLELPYYEVLAWLAHPHCFLCLFYQSVKILPHRLFYLYSSVEPKYLSILLLLVVACYGVWLWKWLIASLGVLNISLTWVCSLLDFNKS